MSLDLTHSIAGLLDAGAIPGRSLTRSKAPGKMFDIGAGPMYAASGRGALLFDVDGNQYIDMLCALGAISLGYGGDDSMGTNVAAAGQVQRGWVYSLPSRLEGSAADAVLQTFAPWASSIRFVKTGSEATHAAYLIAKAATHRGQVLRGDWAYHGWHEWCQQDSSYAECGGINQWAWQSLKIRHGQSLDDCAFPGRVAAVFIEPHRWEPVSIEWLRSVRQWCNDTGALLVFDEMIYGGRWAKGGAAEYFGVTPDLACFGKAIGNGAPIACVVGNQALTAHGEIVSGTYSGDAASLASVIEVARVYDTQPVIETLWARGRQLAEGLCDVIASRGDVSLEGAPVHQRLRFHDPRQGRRFAAAMAQRGVLWHPDVVNVCYAHEETQIDQVIKAARAVLTEMERAAV